MMEMLLTVEQAAERLQLHPETVRRQLKRGELRAIKRGTRLARARKRADGKCAETHKSRHAANARGGDISGLR